MVLLIDHKRTFLKLRGAVCECFKLWGICYVKVSKSPHVFTAAARDWESAFALAFDTLDRREHKVGYGVLDARF